MKTHSSGCSTPVSNNLSIYLSIYQRTSLNMGVQRSKYGLVVVQSNVQALQILLGRRQFCLVMCIVRVQAFLSLFGHYCKMAHIPMFLQGRIRR